MSPASAADRSNITASQREVDTDCYDQLDDADHHADHEQSSRYRCVSHTITTLSPDLGREDGTSSSASRGHEATELHRTVTIKHAGYGESAHAPHPKSETGTWPK